MRKLIFFYLMSIFLALKSEAQSEVDTLWYSSKFDMYFKNLRNKNEGYKIIQKHGKELKIHTYSDKGTLESKFELSDKELESQKAEQITYLPNGQKRRVLFSWGKEMKYLQKSYYNTAGELIGTNNVDEVDFIEANESNSRDAVSYYHMAGPKQIVTKVNAKIIERKTFYRNGELAEHYKVSKSLKQSVSVYFNPNGQELGTMEYNYNAKRGDKTNKSGSKFEYDDKQILSKQDIIENGIIVKKTSYLKANPEVLDYVDNKPFNGVYYYIPKRKIGIEKKIFVNGIQTEEIVYRTQECKRIRSHNKDLKTIYYTLGGDTLGIGIDSLVNGTPRLYDGVKVKYHFNGYVDRVTHFKEGKQYRIDIYKANKTFDDSYLATSEYQLPDDKSYKLTYYKNGEVQSKRLTKVYPEQITYFTKEGDTLSVYNKSGKDGIAYVFDYHSGLILQKLERRKYKLYNLKEWFKPSDNTTAQDDLILKFDYNYESECKTYDNKGHLLYTMTMKDQKPFNGTWIKDGNLYNYKDGLKHGDYAKYISTDYLIETGTMHKGKKHGTIKTYRQNKVKQASIFINGVEQNRKYYNAIGTLIKEEIYKGNRIQKCLTYKSNGKVRYSLNYKKGKPFNGSYVTEDKNYKVRSFKYNVETFKEGKLVKNYKYYNSKVYSLIGEGRDKTIEVCYNPNTENKFSTIGWNNRNNAIDTIQYYSKNGDEIIATGYHKRLKKFGGHVFFQAYTPDHELLLVYLNLVGKEKVLNIFNLDNQLIFSNSYIESGSFVGHVKKYFGKNFTVGRRMFSFDIRFQEIIQSKAFRKKYM